MVAQRTRDYELVMIINPEANEVEIGATVERVANFITEHGGRVIDQANWGLRRLAYPIQRFHEGNYVLTRFSFHPSDVIELDQSLKDSDDVLRHLTTKLDKSVKIEVVEPKPEEPVAPTPETEPETSAEQPTQATAQAPAGEPPAAEAAEPALEAPAQAEQEAPPEPAQAEEQETST